MLAFSVLLQSCFISLILGAILQFTKITHMPNVRHVVFGLWVVSLLLTIPALEPIGACMWFDGHRAIMFGILTVVCLGFSCLMLGGAAIIYVKLRLAPKVI